MWLVRSLNFTCRFVSSLVTNICGVGVGGGGCGGRVVYAGGTKIKSKVQVIAGFKYASANVQ